MCDVLRRQHTICIEVLAIRNPLPVNRNECRLEVTGQQHRDDVGVHRGSERHTFAFAVDDEAHSNRLHTAGGCTLGDLLPQHFRHLVAEQSIDDTAGLLRFDEVHVDVARICYRSLNRILRDLVEHHSLDRHLRAQDLEQVPRDRLALAVLVSGEQELFGILQLLLDLGDPRLLVGVDDIDRLELAVGVHAQPGPWQALELGRHLAGADGEVADMADRCRHGIVRSQIALDGLRLRRGFDDHEMLGGHDPPQKSTPPSKYRVRHETDSVPPGPSRLSNPLMAGHRPEVAQSGEFEGQGQAGDPQVIGVRRQSPGHPFKGGFERPSSTQFGQDRRTDRVEGEVTPPVLRCELPPHCERLGSSQLAAAGGELGPNLVAVRDSWRIRHILDAQPRRCISFRSKHRRCISFRSGAQWLDHDPTESDRLGPEVAQTLAPCHPLRIGKRRVITPHLHVLVKVQDLTLRNPGADTGRQPTRNAFLPCLTAHVQP